MTKSKETTISIQGEINTSKASESNNHDGAGEPENDLAGACVLKLSTVSGTCDTVSKLAQKKLVRDVEEITEVFELLNRYDM